MVDLGIGTDRFSLEIETVFSLENEPTLSNSMESPSILIRI